MISSVFHFLGLKFTITHHSDGHVSTKLSQEAFVDTLQQQAGLDREAVSERLTPYWSGYPIDPIPTDPTATPTEQAHLNILLQRLFGSMNWLSKSTRPNIIFQLHHKRTYPHCKACHMLSQRYSHQMYNILQLQLLHTILPCQISYWSSTCNSPYICQLGTLWSIPCRSITTTRTRHLQVLLLCLDQVRVFQWISRTTISSDIVQECYERGRMFLYLLCILCTLHIR